MLIDKQLFANQFLIGLLLISMYNLYWLGVLQMNVQRSTTGLLVFSGV